MSSESGQRLSMEELKRRNALPSMTQQNCPSKEEWENLLLMISALYRVTTEQSGTLENLNQHNTVQLHPEAAETVRLIYSLYLQGFGQKEIARKLNDLGRKTPAQIRAEQCGREVRAAHKTRDNRYLWTYASVKNVLIEEAYTGVLINHRSETQSGKVKRLGQTEWYRHENFFPVLVEPDVWKLVQQQLKERARPANGNRSKHRYAGLLRCQECGNVFVPMIRYWNGKRRVEYVCKGYHRSGTNYCGSHRIHEENLDTMVWEYLTAVRDSRVKEREKLVKLQKMWALRKPVLDAHICTLQSLIQTVEQEIDDILIGQLKTKYQ